MNVIKKISNRLLAPRKEIPGSYVHFNYIFVHIPKTAGIGISLSLNGVWHGHCMLRQYQLMVNQGKFLEMFKFSFVRDPIDRFVSTVNFIVQGGRAGIGNADCMQLNDEYQISAEGIDAFVEKLDVLRLPFHFIPQHRWLERRDGQLGVDFIGRVEEIEKDYAFIADRLGLSGRKLIHRNRSNPDCVSDVKKFSRNDLEQPTIDKLRLIYDRDYRLFDY
jgi:hypothetical protein